MASLMTEREKAAKNKADLDEKRIIREIEDSFCVAGYDVLDIAVEHVERKIKKA